MNKKTIICAFKTDEIEGEEKVMTILAGRLSIQVCFSSQTSKSSLSVLDEVYSIHVSGEALEDSACILNISVENEGWLTVIVNGTLLDFVPFHNQDEPLDVKLSNRLVFEETTVIDDILEFSERYKTHQRLAALMSKDSTAYPVIQYRNMIISSDEYNFRDPSEIICAENRYWLYFTGIKAPLEHGFTGSIWCSSCSQDDDPSLPENWADPVEVVKPENPETDHDGTGCFTPDCFYDGDHFFVFYTALNSTHPQGFPQWDQKKEPEHIRVAKSEFGSKGFRKTSTHTDIGLSRELSSDEATVPGGGQEVQDSSLIDHGQCWLMDNGERRYYYKGGCAGTGGSVYLMRHLDKNWLNGQRQGAAIINEGTHMEGILITRVEETLFLQLALIWKTPKWRTYTSRYDDGINWELIDDGYSPKPGEKYPMSIGVCQTNNPKWVVGQFPYGKDKIGIGFMGIL